MALAVPTLPDHQAAALAAAYARVVAVKRRQTMIGALAVIVLVYVASFYGEVDLAKLFGNIGSFFNYIGRLFYLDTGAHVFTNPSEWFWGITQKSKWLPLLFETVMVAYLGTVIGFIGALCLSFMSAANMVKSALIRNTAKRFLEFCRTVPELVFALIFVVAFGLGPLPGVLALAIHSMGALGKLFSEVIENIDMKPVEGLQSTGANWVQTIRFAAIPQVLSSFVSYSLLRFEVNVREAGIMGFVGAGGIGQELLVSIRKFYYSDVSAILILIIVTVMLIDLGTERVRHKLIGRESRWS
ncbi:MAG: phosphonate ABC transporter, permease protein PhnE [Beijerinckiaceae bacterium]|nr:phosphonate ABC transporter, permease protein PhnE [Beijerinckiaceae bacterium]